MVRKIVIGIGGASGAIYAKRLLDKLAQIAEQWSEVGLVISQNGIKNWNLELPDADLSGYPFKSYDTQDFDAPFASGSAQYDTMIICPCSMGIVGRIANGISNNLMTRAADVMLKERRKLILVPREAPLSLIHLNLMSRLTEAGAIICPAVPSFYHRPQSVVQLVDTVVDRVLDLAHFEVKTKRWGD